jgi:hypothetical protein
MPSCAHYQGALTCEAFPDGISQEILSGEFDHSNPHPADKGIRFQPAQNADQTSARRAQGRVERREGPTPAGG